MTDTRKEFGDLLGLYNPLLIVVAAIIFAVVGFALVRYRRREGNTSGREGAPLAESLYALALAIVAAGLIAATFHTEDRVDPLSGTPGLHVDITAFKWQWRFEYPGQNVLPLVGSRDEPARLVVPTDTEIRFRLTSHDVIHSFWIPEVRFKRDAFPKRTTQFDLVFDDVGHFTGRCAEFCGLRHADMTFDVDVMTKSGFRSWLAGRRQ